MNNKDIVKKLISAMSGDNGVCFCKTSTLDQKKVLEYGVKLMREDGVCFTEKDIFDITCGEHGENLDTYGKKKGWEYLDNALNVIFDGGELKELTND